MDQNPLIYRGASFPTDQRGLEKEYDGGQRRVSQSPDKRQAELILGAAYFSQHQNRPLNLFITVNWGLADVYDADAGVKTCSLLKAAADYANYHGGNFSAVWVRENGFQSNGLRSGSHVHILAHVPVELLKGFRKHLNNRARHLVKPVRPKAGFFHSLIIFNLKGYRDYGRLAAYDAVLSDKVSYILKGCALGTIETLRLEIVHADQGSVIGKRCGTTENIGRKAWQMVGWGVGDSTLEDLKCQSVEKVIKMTNDDQPTLDNNLKAD